MKWLLHFYHTTVYISPCTVCAPHRCTTTSDQWPLGISISKIDTECVKLASRAGSSVYVKALLVNINKFHAWNPFFLEQHINIVNKVTLQTFWFICTCKLDTNNITSQRTNWRRCDVYHFPSRSTAVPLISDKIRSLSILSPKNDATGHFIFKTLPSCCSRVHCVSNPRQCIEQFVW